MPKAEQAPRQFEPIHPELTSAETVLARELERDVVMLSETIGERNCVAYENLVEAQRFIGTRFAGLGLKLCRQTYRTKGKKLQCRKS